MHQSAAEWIPLPNPPYAIGECIVSGVDVIEGACVQSSNVSQKN
jgi:hypothetical protein